MSYTSTFYAPCLTRAGKPAWVKTGQRFDNADWSAVVAWRQAQTDPAGLWKPGTFRDDRRLKGHLESFWAAYAEYDGTDDHAPETAQVLLEAAGVKAIIAPSKSHMVEKNGVVAPRWHVFAPLSRLHDAPDFEEMQDRLNSALGGILDDPSSWRPTQCFRVGSPHAILVTDGKCLDELPPGVTYPRPQGADETAFDEVKQRSTGLGKDESGIIASFCRNHPLEELLEKYGYVQGDGNDWQSPYSTSGSYAVQVSDDGQHFISLSGSDIAHGAGALAKDGGSRHGDAFDIFVHFEHEGDRPAAFAAAHAGRDAGEVLGTGAPDLPPGVPPSPPPTEAEMEAKRTQFNLQDLFWTDRGIAMSVAHIKRDDIRYVPEFKAWFVKDTERGGWMRDGGSHVASMCSAAAFERAEDAVAQGVPKSTLRSLASFNTTKAVAGLLALDNRLHVAADAFDADPWLLGCPGVVVDLRTGEARPYRPEDMISKHTAVAPSDKVDCRKWLASIERSFGGDAEFIGWMQMLAGYYLIGQIFDPVIPIAGGEGANGKSAFFNPLARIMGDYTYYADESLFLDRGKKEHPVGMAQMMGARLIMAAELPSERLNTERLKRISGGDVLTARGMGKEFFSYRPTGVVTITSNGLPAVSSIDESTRRRFRKVPFDFTVPVDERIEDFEDILVAEEGPGILRWALEGALALQRQGMTLGTCAAVRRASAEYFNLQDPVGRWLDENVVDDPRGWVLNKDLHADYGQWALQNGESVMTATALTKELKDKRGFAQGRRAEGTTTLGKALGNHPLGNVVPIRPTG